MNEKGKKEENGKHIFSFGEKNFEQTQKLVVFYFIFFLKQWSNIKLVVSCDQ